MHAIRILAGMDSAPPQCAGRSSVSDARRRRPPAQLIPRNPFGFKDGTRNLKAEDTDLLRQHLWVKPGDGPD